MQLSWKVADSMVLPGIALFASLLPARRMLSLDRLRLEAVVGQIRKPSGVSRY
jgi:hypothetical protein